MYLLTSCESSLTELTVERVSSWESGAGMDLGPGAWGKLLNGAKALGLKN